jgi:glucose uptake protein GlcU
MIVYPFGWAVAACSAVQLIGTALFGVGLEQWTEWQSRTVSIAGTIAGVAGAVAGLYVAVRSERRAME